MWKFAAVLVTLSLLNACASTQETCASWGFKPGTLEFAKCNQLESNRRNQALQNLGSGLKERRRVRQLNDYKLNQNSFSCTSRDVGNTTYTDCN